MASSLTSSPDTPPAVGARRWLLPVIVLVLAAAGWFGWRAFSPSQQVPAASFTLLDGQKLSTRDLKGKVYLVNFWATSCATCVKEMPNMIQTYNKFKGQGLEFVAVAMRYDPPMYVMNYSQTRQLPFKVAMDADGARPAPSATCSSRPPPSWSTAMAASSSATWASRSGPRSRRCCGTRSPSRPDSQASPRRNRNARSMPGVFHSDRQRPVRGRSA